MATTTVLTELPRSEQLQDDIELWTRNQSTESNHVHVPVYSKFNNVQKRSITAVLAFCGWLATISTTSIFAAIPEVVTTFETTAPIINISNAIYLVFMGISACLWGPSADIFGRRPVSSFQRANQR